MAIFLNAICLKDIDLCNEGVIFKKGRRVNVMIDDEGLWFYIAKEKSYSWPYEIDEFENVLRFTSVSKDRY